MTDNLLERLDASATKSIEAFVATLSPEAVERLRAALPPAPAELSMVVTDNMRSEACRVLNERGKGNAITIPDVYAMLEAALVAHQERFDALRSALREIADGFVAAKDAPAAHDEAVKIARAALTATADTIIPLSSKNIQTGETRQTPTEFPPTDFFAESAKNPAAPTHRHKKRGSTYILIGFGKMQAENWEEREYGATDEPTPGASVDMREVAIYRSADDSSLWVRPREEFEDGRFEALSASEVEG